ncbi:MAG TPA: hypothetical protein DF383_07305 [Deltaproteobacteria bacterium]|nr:hypothetical protein [Deltaproteobacteria bacterium]
MRLLALQVMLLAMLLAYPATAGIPYAEYGPACQWIRLKGEWERPPEMPAEEPFLLTVTYLLPGQKAPATLVTNYPIWRTRFLLVMASFAERIDGVIFVPREFFFASEIKFQYYGSSLDRHWKSEWKESLYQPRWDKQGDKVLCHTEIQLDSIKLEAP